MKKVNFILIAFFAMSLLVCCASGGKEQVWKVENVLHTENSFSNNVLLAALLGEQVKPQFIQLNGNQLKFVYSGNEVFETTILKIEKTQSSIYMLTSEGELTFYAKGTNALWLAINGTVYELSKYS